MTADAPETVDQEKLLSDFKTRLKAYVDENQQMAQKIRQNEQQALKLQGAIETLEYILSDGEPTVDNVEPQKFRERPRGLFLTVINILEAYCPKCRIP